MKSTIILSAIWFLAGCVNIGHLVIGRHWLYFDGNAAKRDLWIKGEERDAIRMLGDPDSYKWERWPKDSVNGSFFSWGYFWVLHLYYGDTVYVFKDHKLYGTRRVWSHEYAQMR